MKKSLSLIAAVGALGVAPFAGAADYTNTSSYNANSSTSTYVGIQAGQMNTRAKVRDLDASGGVSLDSSMDGFTGGVFAGVRQDLTDTVFVGAEANLQAGGADEHLSAYSGGDYSRAKLQTKEGYGVDFLVGMKPVENVGLYAKAGYERTKLKLSGSNLSAGTYASDSKTRKFNGGTFGVGMESYLTDNLTARLEWSQTWYSSKKMRGVKVDPTENLVQVGLAYTL